MPAISGKFLKELAMKNIKESGLVALAVVVSLLAGCAGEVQTGSCSDGEIIDEYICEGGEWVLYDGPCVDADCGINGVCVEDEGEASCDCDSGYEEQGGQCVADDGGDECSGVDCGAE